MLNQPTNGNQATQPSPGADEVAVDFSAVAGDDLVKVLRVSERECREIEECVAL